MFIIRHKNVFFAISIIMVIASVLAIAVYGLNLGTDFRGGTILEFAYTQNPVNQSVVGEKLNSLNLGSYSLQSAGENGFLLKTRPLSEPERVAVLGVLSGGQEQNFVEKRFSSIGPSVGSELAARGSIALALVIGLIILYIAIAFSAVSKPVSSWKYGLIAIVALLHDVLIPTGIFAVLGRFRGVEIDALFLTALLTILGLSVNDTIVVFDRIRENLKRKISKSFEETVGRSLDETLLRSLITSLTVVLVLLSLYFLGGSTTKDFALVLSIGMIVGTYSSIFLASPLLVVVHNWQEKK